MSKKQTLTPDQAIKSMFSKKMLRSVWDWLDQLGIPLHDRRDVWQDVFLAAHRSLSSYDPTRSRPGRWLNRITVHVAAHYRERAIHWREEQSTDELIRSVVDPELLIDERLQQQEELAEVEAAMQKIGNDYCLTLTTYIDGAAMQTIADKLGIPLSTAYKWRTRALAELKDALVEGHKRRRRLI